MPNKSIIAWPLSESVLRLASLLLPPRANRLCENDHSTFVMLLVKLFLTMSHVKGWPLWRVNEG